MWLILIPAIFGLPFVVALIVVTWLTTRRQAPLRRAVRILVFLVLWTVLTIVHVTLFMPGIRSWLWSGFV
jgi:hypothetical protein